MSMVFQENKNEIDRKGFSIINSVYTSEEVEAIGKFIDAQNSSNPTFRKSEDIFAIRQFLKELPDIKIVSF